MSAYTITIKNLDELQRIFREAPAKLSKEVHTAIQVSVMAVQRNVMREAPVNKSYAGGNLRQSVRSRMLGVASGEVSVGAKYASHVEFGTRAHIILPRVKKALANKRTGQFFGKRVNHPGTKANPFFARGIDASRVAVDQAFLRAAQNALQ